MLRAIANRPYEITVVMRNRGVAVAIRWRNVAAYAGGVYVHVVGAVCNRPLGVAVHADVVAGDCKSPLRNRGGVVGAVFNRPLRGVCYG